MPIERRRLLYRGQVQGVGFRYTAHRLSREFPVAGYVRNLRDGSVELVVEGEEPHVLSFLSAISRDMGYFIREVVEEKEPVTPTPMQNFTIRF